MEGDVDEDGNDTYESGPFCRHYDDPSDCEETCATCGHKCPEHNYGSPTECMEDGCDCKEWAEKEEA